MRLLVKQDILIKVEPVFMSTLVASYCQNNHLQASKNKFDDDKLQLAPYFLRIRMHALNRLGCINLQNLCGHHQEEVLRFPKHPQLAKFG